MLLFACWCCLCYDVLWVAGLLLLLLNEFLLVMLLVWVWAGCLLVRLVVCLFAVCYVFLVVGFGFDCSCWCVYLCLDVWFTLFGF